MSAIEIKLLESCHHYYSPKDKSFAWVCGCSNFPIVFGNDVIVASCQMPENFLMYTGRALRSTKNGQSFVLLV